MVKRALTIFLVLAILAAEVPAAYAVSLNVGGTAVPGCVTYNSTTYVPLRSTAQLLCKNPLVSWSDGQAIVKTSSLTLTARPGTCYISANGRMLFVSGGILIRNGTTYVPIRVLAKATGATVSWNAASQSVYVSSGSGTITSGSSFYDPDAVYWLSRIISAESSGESLSGKIAVGNVILNRVASPDFPDTIYTVIFDRTGGTQFTPVANGTIYNSPTSDSILAAKLCLDGASVAGRSLFFLNPVTASSSWIATSRSFVVTIGNHAFYAQTLLLKLWSISFSLPKCWNRFSLLFRKKSGFFIFRGLATIQALLGDSIHMAFFKQGLISPSKSVKKPHILSNYAN